MLKTIITWSSFWLMFVATATYAQAQRVVAIDGSLTEIIYALGKQKLLVGRDATSLYPKDVEKLPSVGYMRNLSAEGILSLKPTLVLATSDAKPQSVLTRLKKAGVAIEIVKNEYSIDGVKQKILAVGRAIGEDEAGQALAHQFVQQAETAIQMAKQREDKVGKRKALFLMNARGNQLLVAGTDTRANEILKLAGVTNPAAQDMSGYKPLTAEGAIQYNPNYIIGLQTQMSESQVRNMLKMPALSLTQAARQQRYMVLAGDDLSFGPRLPLVIEKVSARVFSD